MALVILLGYAIGSVPFALLLARRWGAPDLRTIGSGNLGAANVFRASGVTAGILVAALDITKGALSVTLARYVSDQAAAPAAAGLAAIVGHIYPIWIRFRGGKGVATACGVMFGFDLWLGLGTLVTWILIAVFFRLSSLAALVAALFAPSFAFWLFGLTNVLWAVASISLLLVWRHRGNIARLVSGQESRIGAKSGAGR